MWLTFSARTTTDRILAIVPPITAFVTAGFEHSIANMYYLPIALLIKAGAPAAFWAAIGKTVADIANLTWGRFLVNNLLPVTLGNIIGGALMVRVVFWFVYLRPLASRPDVAAKPSAHAADTAPAITPAARPLGVPDNGHRPA